MAGQLCGVGGEPLGDAYRHSRAYQETGGFRGDAHHGHRRPRMRLGRIPPGVPRHRHRLYRLDAEQLLDIDEVTYAMSESD